MPSKPMRKTAKPAAKPAVAKARLARTFGAVNIGSFRISAMIMGETETGDLLVLGSGHRASQGIKRGYVTDMRAATYAIRDAVERAEQNAQTPVNSVWVACAGAGLESYVYPSDIEIGGRRIEEEDIEQLMRVARAGVQPDGREVLHAQPAHYTLDGAHGVADPRGLHAERLGVHVHVTLADGAPLQNLKEAVHNAHLKVTDVVAAPLASAYACLSEEERDLGVALVEIGADVTNVSVFASGMLVGLRCIDMGSGDITDAIASSFGVRRFQAERLKCVAGSAISSPSDHREMIPVHGPNDGWGEDQSGPLARGADEKNRIARAELISVITQRLGDLTTKVSRALKELGFSGAGAGQVVLTGGGAELAGLAEYTQSALGMPVRIGRTPQLTGLPEAHATPGFSTLAGLCLYAAEDPADIQALGGRYQEVRGSSGGLNPLASLQRLWRASREYF
ncbi:MAG: cell division protein FtsA [Pseudomonadota bacterium]|nr:cell division protein FtsA [Pseudomonadota bacterium]